MSVLGRRLVAMFEDDLPASSDSRIGAIGVDVAGALKGGSALFEALSQSEPAGPGASSPTGQSTPGDVLASGVEGVLAELAPFGPLSPFGEAGAAVLEELSGQGLLELLAAWDVVEAQAAAGKRAVAAALEERFAPRIVTGSQGRVEVKGQAACEVAIRLGISQQRAGLLVGEGLLFNGILAEVGLALAAGAIDAGKAGLFAKVLGDQEAAVAFAVVDTLLPEAPCKPHAQLEKDLNAELIRVDPVVAAKRFERAMRLRRLEQVQLRPDGMASIRLVGAVFDVAQVYVHADASARATKATGDERTMDQLRADALFDLVKHRQLPPGNSPQPGLESGQEPDEPDGPSGAGGPSGPDGPGGPGGPREPGGQSGACSADSAGAATATTRAVDKGPEASATSNSETSRAALTSAEVGALPMEEWSAYARACRDLTASQLADPGELGQISRLIAGLRASAAHHKANRSLPPTPPGVERPPLVHATGPASTLTLLLSRNHLRPLGDEPLCLAEAYRDELYAALPDDPKTENREDGGASLLAGAALPMSSALPTLAPASPPPLPAAILGRDVPYVLGFGPIDPVTARALIAERPSNLRIKVYDDLEADHSRWLTAAPEERHDPCPALQRHLATYYPTCIAPTCTVRATICDNDHVIEYPLGPTHVTNLRPLCRHHHLLKTHAGHRLELDETGTLIWITALGIRRPAQHQERHIRQHHEQLVTPSQRPELRE